MWYILVSCWCQEIPFVINRNNGFKFNFFIRPFKSLSFYVVAMSTRPSVCPSVRLFDFSGFYQFALRYQFETWYIHLVSWYISSALHIYSHNFLFFAYILLTINASFAFYVVFQTIFYMFWDTDFTLGISTPKLARHIEFECHHNRDTLTYFTGKLF